MTTTIFNAWSTLRQLTGAGPATCTARPAWSRPPTRATRPCRACCATAPEALARALDVIAQSLANFARHCLAAGADGVYLSVRDDWVDHAGTAPASTTGWCGRAT